jgi:hypothetical protein
MVCISPPSRSQIDNLKELHRGDHIAFQRKYVIWHHAIVGEDVRLNGCRGKVKVIHNSGTANEKLRCQAASVREEEIDIDLQKDELYRYDYDSVGGRRFSADEIVQRARSRFDEKYNALRFNCEHFAWWCTTGEQKSEQCTTARERLVNTSLDAIIKTVQEAVVTVVEYTTNFSFKLSDLVNFFKRPAILFRGVNKVSQAVKAGAIVCNVLSNLLTEGVQFGILTYRLYEKLACNLISRTDFNKQLTKRGFECLGGFIGATVFGIGGQFLIPVPVLGGFLGTIAGNLLCRFLGAAAGVVIARWLWQHGETM